jgi:Short C-terminal domain
MAPGGAAASRRARYAGPHMTSGPETLTCDACGSYVHPFLDACPTCGVARPSGYEASLATPALGYGALLADPLVAEQVRQIVVRYTMKRSWEPGVNSVRDGLVTIAGSLAYRVMTEGTTRVTSEQAHLDLIEDVVVVREHAPPREIQRVRLDAILAISHRDAGTRRADAWSGLAFGGRLEETPAPSLDGDLVVTSAGDKGLERFALVNRRGFFAARARPDHYEILTRWLGILAGAAAEERWIAIGSQRYAVQLGLAAGPGDETHGAPTTGASVAATGAGTARPGPQPPPEAPTVRDALEALEELRDAGLVTDDEYAAKRREILARL